MIEKITIPSPIESVIASIPTIRDGLESDSARIKSQRELFKTALEARLQSLRLENPGISDKDLVRNDTAASFLSQAAGALTIVLDAHEAAIHGELHNLENELPGLIK